MRLTAASCSPWGGVPRPISRRPSRRPLPGIPPTGRGGSRSSRGSTWNTIGPSTVCDRKLPSLEPQNPPIPSQSEADLLHRPPVAIEVPVEDARLEAVLHLAHFDPLEPVLRLDH